MEPADDTTRQRPHARFGPQLGQVAGPRAEPRSPDDTGPAVPETPPAATTDPAPAPMDDPDAAAEQSRRGRRRAGAAEVETDPLVDLFVAERPLSTASEPRTATRFEEASSHRLGRRATVAFVFAFAAARVLALLIMTGRLPDVFAPMGGTYAHHLNFGAVLLGGVGAYLLLARPRGRALLGAAAALGVALALGIDELGMWVHASGGYWPRLWFDVVVLAVGVIGVIASAPPLGRLRGVHAGTGVLLGGAVALVAGLLVDSMGYADLPPETAAEGAEYVAPRQTLDEPTAIDPLAP